VQKVGTLVTNVPVDMCDGSLCSLPAMATTLAARQSLLLRSESGKRLAKVARIVDLLARRQGSETGKAKIYTYRGIVLGTGRITNLTTKAYIPVVTISPDGNGLDSSRYSSVQPDLESADLRQSKLITTEPPALLRIGETVIPIPTLKARVSRRLASFHTTKEPLEGFINTVYHVLQGLGIDLYVFGTYLLHRRKLLLLIVAAQVYARHTIGISTLLQSRIVQLAAAVERPLKALRLAPRWVKPELVCSSKHSVVPSLVARWKYRTR
jgi:hypothetical protein